MLNDERLKQACSSFIDLRTELAERFGRKEVLDFDEFVLPEKPRPSHSFVFIGRADDFTSGLVGELNRFLIGLIHADAWCQIAKKYEEPEALELLFEYAEPHLELSVGRPYSIRNQFIFSAVHLLHQSKRLKDAGWVDELPEDCKIDYRTLDHVKAAWSNLPNFIASLNTLNDTAFQKNTLKFRHRVQHRFRTQFERGLTPVFEREKTSAGISYHRKILNPIPLDILIPELYEQRKRAVLCLRAFWRLLQEMCEEWDSQFNLDNRDL